jgi:tetratricopeptide (TPR) repeat protein
MSQTPAHSARELLEAVAFFPQGVSENNLDWLFPTISDRRNIMNKFCLLSLTNRNNGFITMLAPIRDYLTPKNPKSSPLLCATKDRYFSRLSVDIDPESPGFGETVWIASEDVNVEHLLDVFISIDPDADDTWHACDHFMEHLYYHKPRHTLLQSKIEDLLDGHPSKPKCLSNLSLLFGQVGNHAEEKRLLTHTLKLDGQRKDRSWVAQTLRFLSDANRCLGLHEEGIEQAKEAREIYEQLGDTTGQGLSLNVLAQLLFDDLQLDAAETAAFLAIDLLSEKGEEYAVCQLHRVLGRIYHSRGERGKATHHFETAIRIGTRFNWHDQLFWNHYNLADLFRNEGALDDANTYIEQAKSHAIDNAYNMGRALEIQAWVWYKQRRIDDEKPRFCAHSKSTRSLGLRQRLGIVGILSGGSKEQRKASLTQLTLIAAVSFWLFDPLYLLTCHP